MRRRNAPNWPSPGARDVVGDKVALQPESGKQPIWHAAGKVHPSLKLGEVRGRFPDTVEAATEAVATWRRVDGARKAGVAHDQRGDAPTPGTSPAGTTATPAAGPPRAMGGRDPVAAARGLAEMRRRLDAPPTIVQAEGQAAGLAAGQVVALAQVIEVSRASAAAWAALGEVFEPHRRGPYTAAAEATWRLGSTTLDGDQLVGAGRSGRRSPDGTGRAVPTRVPAHTGIARSIRLIAQAGSDHHAQSWAAVLEQLVLTVAAIAEALRANHLAHEAAYLTAKTEAAADQLGTLRLAAGREDDPSSRDPGTGTLSQPATVSPNLLRPEARPDGQPEVRRGDQREGGGRPRTPPWRDPNRDPIRNPGQDGGHGR